MTVSNVCPIEIKPHKFVDYAKKGAFTYRLTSAAKAGKIVYQNEYNKLCNSPYARELNQHITIQQIFRNPWKEFLEICKSKNKPIRGFILKNVDAMIYCKDFSKVYLFYECKNCGDIHIQGLSCHSRFCVSCGKKYRDARALEISKTCIRVPHRHITWTISSELRDFFQCHHELYDELFGAVSDCLTYLISGKNKSARKRKESIFRFKKHTV